MRIDIHSHMIPKAQIDALREEDNVCGARAERNASPNAPGLPTCVLGEGSIMALAGRLHPGSREQ